MLNIAQILILSFFAAPVQAQVPLDPQRVKEVAAAPRWQRLLHYKSHWFTGHHSAIDGKGFFFSREGAKDAEKELRATIDAFTSAADTKISKLSQPPACAFPARFRYLNEEFQLGLTMPKCEKWEEFLSRFNGYDSVTLIFSTAYPNNPASMFGHSFLRINSWAEPGRAKLDLLDYGLSYAAQVPEDENNFLFVWFGLTGGYIGTFSSIPYYAKVQEYNNSESRDLWEYDLNINHDETWWLLANVWEIEVNSYSDYYFFDENCSYEILSLLEVAKPDWQVADYLFHMIPGESVKKVARQKGAIAKVKFRPSLFKKLNAYGERLSAEERKSFFSIIQGGSPAAAATVTLDAGIQYFYYLKQQKSGALSEGDSAIFQKILAERSHRGPPAPEPIFEEKSRPELGHHASRLSLGAGMQKGTSGYGAFEEIGIKFAYHDLLNHDIGFVPFSEISFPHIDLRWFSKENRLWVQRIEFLSINSLSPWSWMKHSLSWRAVAAYEVPIDQCSFCHILHAEGNVGFSQAIAEDRWRSYQLAGIYSDTGKALNRGWRTGPKLTFGLLANVTEKWKHQIEWSISSNPWAREKSDRLFSSALWGQSFFFSQEWESRLLSRFAVPVSSGAQSRNEIQAQFLYYF